MIEFVEYDETFLELSWKWLNDPVIKKMTNTPDFTKEQQQKWFLSLKDKKDYVISGILYNKQKVGALGLKNITATSTETFLYIGEKEHWDKGFAHAAFQWSVKKAKELQLQKICAVVVKSNTRVIKVNKLIGYKIIEEKSDSEKVVMEYHLAQFK